MNLPEAPQRGQCDFGSPLDAINWAVDRCQNTIEINNFLRSWREGDLDHWPEYLEWLTLQPKEPEGGDAWRDAAFFLIMLIMMVLIGFSFGLLVTQ